MNRRGDCPDNEEALGIPPPSPHATPQKVEINPVKRPGMGKDRNMHITTTVKVPFDCTTLFTPLEVLYIQGLSFARLRPTGWNGQACRIAYTLKQAQNPQHLLSRIIGGLRVRLPWYITCSLRS